LEASQAIARLHRLHESRTIFVQQNPEAIDAGAFHNDVVSVGNRNVLFYHEKAFLGGEAAVQTIRERFEESMGRKFVTVEVLEKQVPLADAVKSYLFNSQLVTLADGSFTLIAPTDCEETPSVRRYLEDHLDTSAISTVRFFNVKQSMRNGGGPACLRLRVVLTEDELKAANPKVILTDELYRQLTAWVEKHYRDRLSVKDLADPSLLMESRTALDDLTRILNLGSVYRFQ
jgi:succinylarginine dihydrolase